MVDKERLFASKNINCDVKAKKTAFIKWSYVGMYIYVIYWKNGTNSKQQQRDTKCIANTECKVF